MHLTRFIGPRRRRDQGNITIEMALAMPVFLLLVAGVLDLGMLFWEKHVITNAAREGARAAAKAVDTGTAVTADLTQTQVKQVVHLFLHLGGRGLGQGSDRDPEPDSRQDESDSQCQNPVRGLPHHRGRRLLFERPNEHGRGVDYAARPLGTRGDFPHSRVDNTF
jgi:hypothetical protein